MQPRRVGSAGQRRCWRMCRCGRGAQTSAVFLMLWDASWLELVHRRPPGSKCRCKTKCQRDSCGCRRGGRKCTAACKCCASQCANNAVRAAAASCQCPRHHQTSLILHAWNRRSAPHSCPQQLLCAGVGNALARVCDVGSALYRDTAGSFITCWWCAFCYVC